MAVFDMCAHTWRETVERQRRLDDYLHSLLQRDRSDIGRIVREGLASTEHRQTPAGIPIGLFGSEIPPRVAPLGWSSRGGLGVYGVMMGDQVVEGNERSPDWEWRPMQRNADGTYPTPDWSDVFSRWQQHSFLVTPSGVGVRYADIRDTLPEVSPEVARDLQDLAEGQLFNMGWLDQVAQDMERRWEALSPEERETIETELALGTRIERLESGDYHIPEDDPFFETIVAGMVESNKQFWAALPETRRQELRNETPLLREATRRLDTELGIQRVDPDNRFEGSLEDAPEPTTVTPDALDQLFANIDAALEEDE